MDNIPILKASAAVLDDSRLEYLAIRRFDVNILPRWASDLCLLKDNIVCYTDGCRTDGRTASVFTVLGHREVETTELVSSSIYLGE